MIIDRIQLTADNRVQIYDVDGSLQHTLSVDNVLDIYAWCLQQRDVLLERYRQEQAKTKTKVQEKSE